MRSSVARLQITAGTWENTVPPAAQQPPPPAFSCCLRAGSTRSFGMESERLRAMTTKSTAAAASCSTAPAAPTCSSTGVGEAPKSLKHTKPIRTYSYRFTAPKGCAVPSLNAVL